MLPSAMGLFIREDISHDRLAILDLEMGESKGTTGERRGQSIIPRQFQTQRSLPSCQRSPQSWLSFIKEQESLRSEVTDLKLTCQTPHQYYDSSQIPVPRPSAPT